jgi:hypothetical protein
MIAEALGCAEFNRLGLRFKQGSFMSVPKPTSPVSHTGPPIAPDPNCPGPLCANCGAAVADAYCGRCGQRALHHVESLREFLGEAAEVLTHADSRVWRTFIPLVFRPGFLTQQYLQGRRASYLPPFRLYIVLSVIFFLVVSFNTDVPNNTAGGHVGAREAASQASAALKQALDESTDPEDRAVLRQQLQRLNTLDEKLTPAAGATEKLSCAQISTGVSLPTWLAPRMISACEKIMADNGKELAQSLFHNIGRAMFVFLPLLAALMKILYWRPKHFYVEHLLLLLHNHAFLFLIMSIFILATRFIHSDTVMSVLNTGLAIYAGYYPYESMRRVYGQGRGITLLKFAVLFCGYSLCAIFTLVLTALYSAATL